MEFFKSNNESHPHSSHTQPSLEKSNRETPFFLPQSNNAKTEAQQDSTNGAKPITARNHNTGQSPIQLMPMQKEQTSGGPCIEKTSRIFSYNNYGLDDPIGVDTNLLNFKKELSRGQGEIKRVNIISYCFLGGEPGTKYALELEEIAAISSKYKALLDGAGITYTNALFNVSARNGQSAGENDGGCLITVQFKYSICN